MTAVLQKGVLVSLTEANRPAPLTPRDCVVRGEYMPLYGDRLFTSTFMANATAVEFRAGMRLWWEAWQQRPAASLPNEEKVLAHLTGSAQTSVGGGACARWRSTVSSCA